MTSTPPSGTSKPLDYSQPVVFIDRNIDGPDLCDILRKARIVIRRHVDHFHAEEDDDVWITKVANNDWAILSADQNIERHHLDAVIKSKAKVAILMGRQ